LAGKQINYQMKKTGIVLVVWVVTFLLNTPVSAQVANDHKWAERSTGITDENVDFSHTSLSIKGHRLLFNDLPNTARLVVVTFTNIDGETVQQAKIHLADNKVDIRYLTKGTYFINLLYRNEKKKGFVLNL
jgi:hypothetical protein